MMDDTEYREKLEKYVDLGIGAKAAWREVAALEAQKQCDLERLVAEITGDGGMSRTAAERQARVHPDYQGIKEKIRDGIYDAGVRDVKVTALRLLLQRESLQVPPAAI